MNRGLLLLGALLLALGGCDSGKPAGSGRGGSGGSGGTPAEGGSGGSCADDDGDGYTASTCGGTDCDDDAAPTFPGTRELCRDGVDQDCDGTPDDGCECTAGDMRACWTGADAERGRGACRDGWQRCDSFGAWSACAGQVLRATEPAACDGVDQDCDGRDVAACDGCQAAEICGDGIDQNCDGTRDDPATCDTSCLPSQDPREACCGDCAAIACDDRAGQNCYSGPPATLGFGACHAGLASCSAGGWGPCAGEVVPVGEVCGNGLDDDCDGLIDEGDASGHACARAGCRAEEACGNGLDDDCDGFVDEACVATAAEQPCYTGPSATLNRGVCRNGVQKRQDDGFWGPCAGPVIPGAERCGDALDTDCNDAGGPGQLEDAGCCVPAGDEVCNGADDDCDGLVDEGLMNRCGSCATSCPGTVEIADLDTCDRPGRTCDRIEAGPDGLTVKLGGPAADVDHGIYFFVSNTVIRRFDTETGKTSWDLTVAEEFSLPGNYAVGPDGSLWVASAKDQAVLHVGTDGKLICGFPFFQDFGYWGLAVDEAGTAWLLFGDNQKNFLYRVPADSRDGTTCLSTKVGGKDFLTIDTTLINGMVAGPSPDLWLMRASTVYPHGLRLNRDTLELTKVKMAQPWGPDDPVVDGAGHLWFTSYDGMVDIAPDDDGTNATTYRNSALREPTVTGANDGRVWGVRFTTNGLGYLDLETGETQSVALPSKVTYVQALTTDVSGRIWMHGWGSGGFRAELSYDPSTKEWTTYEDQQPLINGPDAACPRSSAPLQRLLGRKGTLRQVLDGGSGSIAWSAVSWDASVPPGADLKLFVKTAATAAGLASAKACGPFDASPGDLSTCPGGVPRGRYLQIEAGLQSGKSGAPVIRSATVAYELP